MRFAIAIAIAVAVALSFWLSECCIAGAVRGSVTDATTGEPVGRFRVIPAAKSGRLHVLYNHTDRMRAGADASDEFENGEYLYEPRFNMSAHVIRIEAEGYLPATSDVMDLSGDAELTFDAQLQPAPNIERTILQPDGKAAAGALVLLRTPHSTVVLQDENPTRQTSAPTAQTDDVGHFVLPPADTNFRLVVLHDSGYLDIRSEEFRKSPEQLKLTPWARLEGTLKQGSKPGANQRVTVWWHTGEADELYVSRGYEVTTDAEGRFVFERLPAGRPRVGRFIETSKSDQSSSWTITNSKWIDLLPGQTHRVQLGGVGQPVVGRFVELPDSDDEWRFSHSAMSSKLAEVPIPIPEEVLKAGAESYRAWRQKWDTSEEGKAWFAANQRLRDSAKHHAFTVAPDGTFRMEDVEPGTYVLHATISSIGDHGLLVNDKRVEYEKEITIAAVPGGQSDEQVNIGDIPPSERQ